MFARVQWGSLSQGYSSQLLGLTEELQKRGVEFISLNDQIDTTSTIGKAMFGMLAVLVGPRWSAN